MDVQRGAQERYWKRAQVMRGVIRKDGLAGWVVELKMVSQFWNLLYDGCTDGTKGNESMVTAESCRVKSMQAFECTIWRKSYWEGDTWTSMTAISRHMCRWSSSDTIKNVLYNISCPVSDFWFHERNIVFQGACEIVSERRAGLSPRALPPHRFAIRRLFPF
jgi:hypothetical protein